MLTFLHAVLDQQVYLAQGVVGIHFGDDFKCTQFKHAVEYSAFCDDFGPMNMSSVLKFVQQLDEELASHPSCTFFYAIDNCQRSLTNAVFLLGCYMILRLDLSTEEVGKCFAWVRPDMMEAYRDATFESSDFDLTVMDCWRGLVKGMELGWLELPTTEEFLWGAIDIDEYDHYDNPLNGFLHVIIPSRLIAFQCPSNLSDIAADNNGQWLDSEGQRFFGPAFYADILGGDFGVQVVVRCDREDDECDQDDTSDDEEGELATTSSGYDESAFALRGLAVERLAVPRDGVLPSSALLHDVDRFLTLARLAPGPVAIHGGAGLGLGCGGELLVSSLLIKRYGFDARSAIAWRNGTP